MKLVNAGDYVKHGVAGKETKRKLWKMAEEICIPWQELSKLAMEVVGEGNTEKLSDTQCKRLMRYMERNQANLGERFRAIRWNGRL